MKRILVVIVALAVLGAVIGGGLYLAFPVQVSTIAGLTRNYILSIGAPAGTATVETNPAYKAAGGAAPSAPSASAAAGDWPSYNRTVNSDRLSPLAQINTKNAGQLKVL